MLNNCSSAFTVSQNKIGFSNKILIRVSVGMSVRTIYLINSMVTDIKCSTFKIEIFSNF